MWFLQARCGLLFTIINYNHNHIEMGTVNGWRTVGVGGVANWGKGSSANGNDGERLLFKLPPTPS